MKRTNILWVLPAALLLTACGGGESTEDGLETDAPAETVEESIAYGPFMTTEEVRETDRLGTLEEFNAVEDKTTVIRYVSSEYNTPFPTELLDAINLQVLNLHLDDELPEDLGVFKNLTTLVVAGKMTKMPESVGELEHLKAVSLYGCKGMDINQVMDVLVNCENLEYLDISGMGYTELPANIGDFKKLKHVRLGNNPMASLPESFYTLPVLEVIKIGGNEGMDYEAVLTAAKALPALTNLTLGGCGFSTLPKVLGEYPALTKVVWREDWEGLDGDQIAAKCEKEGAKFESFEVSWNNMSGMFYDIY